MSGDNVFTTTDVVQPSEGTLIEAGISAKQRQQLVDAHNQKRQLVADGKGQWVTSGGDIIQQPSASNMKLMVYDSRKESIPINWAKTCPKSYNLNIGYGENRFIISVLEQPRLISFPVAWAVDSWYSEIQYMSPYLVYSFTDASNGAKPAQIGHYTQVVWAETNQLFCGLSICKFGHWQLNVVCNYGPQGNYQRQPVYNQGLKCSDCPAGTACASPYDALCAPK